MEFNGFGISMVDDVVYIDADNMAPGIEFLKRHAFDKIGIYCEDKRPRTIDFSFLEYFPETTYLRSMPKLSNRSTIEAIYKLKGLRHLEWTDTNLPLHVSRFKQLDVLACEGDAKIPREEARQVSLLVLWRARDLQLLSSLNSVRKLELRNFLGDDLSGIEQAPFLESLMLKVAKKLNQIDDIFKCERLKIFEADSVSKTLNYDPLIHCDKLSEIYLRSGARSCKFLSDARSVLVFWCCGVIEDGDLDPIFLSRTLKHVYINPFKKFYNRNKGEIESHGQAN
mgnify:FL=1